MNAYISCVGCEQRELDSQRVINYLENNGINLVDSAKKADYIFVITCGVDLASEQRSVEEIRNIANMMPESSKLVVGGCLPSISPDVLKEFDVYHTFSPRSIETLILPLGLDTTIKPTAYPNKFIYDNSSSVSGEATARDRF